MRILMLSARLHVPGPLPKIVPVLMEALRGLGCPVAFLPWGQERADEALHDKLVGRGRDLGAVLRALRAGSFDAMVIHTAHDWRTIGRDIPLLVATRRLCPGVVQFHGSQSGRLIGPGNRLFRLGSACLLRLSRGALVLSEEERRQWEALCPGRPVRVVDNPAVPLPPPADPAPAWLAALPPEEPVILFVARLIPEKGILDLLEAFARLRQKTPCRLLVAGDGSHAEVARARARALGAAGAVTFAGYASGGDLSRAYRAATVFALPTFFDEGFPTVITEAMQVGLPVVTTRIRGMADHLQQGVNALFVPARDPDALAEALERLLGDRALRSRMGRANREKVKELAPGLVARRYLATVADIVSAG